MLFPLLRCVLLKWARVCTRRVLALQRHKLQHGSAPAPVAAAAGAGGGGGGGGAAEEGVATEAVDRRVLLAFFDNL